jgi:acetylornithine deacetylase/succinyl-diaminopimelate desuccinylase-like protein
MGRARQRKLAGPAFQTDTDGPLMRFLTASLLLLTSTVQAASPATTAAERTEARDIYARIIAFRTEAGQGQVPVMAGYLAGLFREAGFPEADIHVLPLGETAALVVRYRGDGSGGRPILLTAHMDVVPARREDWQRDPYTLVEEGGYFFGRGTMDIKADVAAIAETFLRLKREGFVPTRDLVIAFSGDEETEQATTRALVTEHRALTDAEFALNGDGGEGVLDEQTGKARIYYLQGAEKSYATYVLEAHNPGGHSSEPRLENAIYDLADALKALQAYRFPVMWNEWTLGSLAASGAAAPGELGEAMRRFAANPRDEWAANRLFREPTYVGKTRTTCVATMLSAGHAENALPQLATATVNCRIFPGVTAEAVRAELQRVVGDKVGVTLPEPALEAVASPMRDDVRRAVEDAVHASYPGVPVVPDQAPYTTDGSVLRAAGIPTYGVSGAFLKDSDSFSHGLNERLPVASFYNMLTHWYVLVTELAGRR